jgi:signal transduction histidine kinase
MKTLFALIAAFAVAILSLQVQAQDAKRASRAEAQAMVKKAIEYYNKNGRDKALAEFVKSPGPFVDRDLYVTVYNLQGDALAHINPKMVGKNMMELRDADGKYHIRERMESAAKGTSGWQDFKFFNPVSKQIEPKEMYWEKHDKLVFACGAYKPV